MSLLGTKEKLEIEKLKKKIADLESIIPAESVTVADLQNEISRKQAELQQLNTQAVETEALLKRLNEQVIETDEQVMLQSFGLYTPRYSFMRVDDYKACLLDIRSRQKDMVKNRTAVFGSNSWSVNGDAQKGRKMVADMQKLLLRAFNSECDDIIEHVKYNNIESSEKRIKASMDAISRLGEMMGVFINPQYYQLKIEELYLAFEYQQKKQQEKEELREIRARMREEAKLAKEIEEARKKLEKERAHYKNALIKITKQLETASDVEKSDILEKKQQIEEQLGKISSEVEAIDYRAANQRAGYVYVISNVGAFGENVYKIGMTRRLDPTERVDELGDASVPFNFDIHAMIFSDDAPKLEAALHNAFADRKLNFVNQRREFFNVSLDEIKRVVRENYDKSVEFIDLAPADQYRQSLILRQQAQGNSTVQHNGS
ncbi:DUF4041 domain-containing protein [Intestinibacillus massiliensis]|uniref:DUF4041 domain-containing protein n=1 Tax=Intestinibacillus massiliensis TaxID=1871029 RepID=UPI000B35073A|nr:DUF4041 domain-containing protein [Intestinibacillus massiliensis]